MRPRPAAVAPVVAALALLAAVTPACRQPSPSREAVSRTEDNLGRITSGVLAMRLLAGAGEQAGRDQAGFELDGPFALARPGQLPVARVDYTQVSGPQRTTVQLLATGRNAFVTVGGRTYALAPQDVEALRAPRDTSRRAGGLGQLRLGRWFERPELSDGGLVDGVATDRIRGTLDVVDALNDLFALARRLGAGDVAAVPVIEGRSAEHLRAATGSATVEMLTGSRDRLLRRLAFEMRLRAEVSPPVREALGRLAAARITFELDLTGINRPVTVPEPRDALPPSALPRRR